MCSGCCPECDLCLDEEARQVKRNWQAHIPMTAGIMTPLGSMPRKSNGSSVCKDIRDEIARIERRQAERRQS